MITGILLLLVIVAGGGGFWLGKNGSSNTKTSSSKESWNLSNTYSQRFQTMRHWQEILTEFHKSLFNTYTVDDMGKSLFQCIKETYPSMYIMGGVGSLQDFLILDTLKMMHIEHLEMGSKAFMLAYPEMEDGNKRELIEELYKAVVARGTARRTCFLLKEISAPLQLRLERQYHFPKLTIVAPIYCGDILTGIMLYSSNEIQNNPELLHDIYSFIIIINETIATWLKAMAPHILSDRAENPGLISPMQGISSLNILEQTLSVVQQDDEQQRLLDKLAQYSQNVVTPSPEISLLASQTCATMRNICQEDFTMFLLPAETDQADKFRIEAFETNLYIWSRSKGYIKQDGPVIFSQFALDNVADPFVEKIVKNGQLIEIKFARDVQVMAPSLDRMQLESMVIIPSIVRGKCNAILVVGRRAPGGLPDLVKSISISVTSLAGISLSSLYQLSEIGRLKESLNASWNIFAKVNEQYINALIQIVKKHGILIMTRAEDVSLYSVSLAQQLRLDSKKIGLVKMAAMFCDIGMILIPPSIIRKEAGLTKEEWQLIQNHPKFSVDLLQNLDIMKEAIEPILHHHEHYDGNGYPDGLRGENIPIESRIIRVADAYVNLQINRPYRSAFSQAEAINLIMQDSSKQFDPAIVKALIQIVTNQVEDRRVA